MDKPKLLIATPAYGGLFTQQYVDSILNLHNWLGKEDIPFYTYFIGNESLITRARNTCATLAVVKDFDKLLFIDADVGFTQEDVHKLYYSDKKIIGGLYPHKTYPIRMNFNPILGETVVLKNGEAEVEHIATGFLMIDVSVLKELSKQVPQYDSAHINGKSIKYFDFFRCGANLFPDSPGYLSEDWYFCELARRAGHKCYANVGIRLTHTGTHTFKPDFLDSGASGDL